MLDSSPMTALGARVSSRAAALPALLAITALLGCGGSGAAAEERDRRELAGTGDGEDAAEPATATASPTNSSAPDAPSDPSPPAAGVYPGTYFVPVPPELEPYALFSLESVRLELRGDELELQYDLPELLLGEARQISFRGGAAASGEYQLEGDEGVARCRRSAGRLRCDEVLGGVDIDTRKIDRLLATMPRAEASARRSVADRFTIDPIGVLEVGLDARR